MKLQRDLQAALTKLLINALTPEGAGRPFAVITTAPGQWLSETSSEKFTIIDVTAITGTTSWVTEMDIRDRVLDSVRAVGWSDAQLKAEHRSSSIVPDLVLVGSDEEPLAVIELKSQETDLTNALNQARKYAAVIKANFGVATDGQQFLFGNANGQDVQNSRSFPTPEQLNHSLVGSKRGRVVVDQSLPSILRPNTIAELSGYIDSFSVANLILDFTFPWNDRESATVKQVRQFLGELARPFRYLDSLSAVLLFASTRKPIKRLVGLLPKGVAFALQHSGLREFLMSRLPLAGVIDLPGGIFLPVSNVACNVVALGDFPIRSEKGLR